MGQHPLGMTGFEPATESSEGTDFYNTANCHFHWNEQGTTDFGMLGCKMKSASAQTHGLGYLLLGK